MQQLRDLLEEKLFGVCNYLADKIGVSSTSVRLYFIYLSFVTMGSPLIIYLVVAFWLNVKRYIRQKRRLLWQ